MPNQRQYLEKDGKNLLPQRYYEETFAEIFVQDFNCNGDLYFEKCTIKNVFLSKGRIKGSLVFLKCKIENGIYLKNVTLRDSLCIKRDKDIQEIEIFNSEISNNQFLYTRLEN